MSDAIMIESEPIVTVTPAAVKQVRRQIERQGGEKRVLRLGVKGGGCSGLSYVLRLEEAATERDIVYQAEDVTIAIDPKSAKILAGTTLDYSLANLLEGGWKFDNPNAAKSCGCGTSFTPK